MQKLFSKKMTKEKLRNMSYFYTGTKFRYTDIIFYKLLYIYIFNNSIAYNYMIDGWL